MSHSPRVTVLTLGIGALLATAAAPLSAQGTPFLDPSRVSTYNLTFTDFNRFLDGMAGYQFTHDISTNTGVALSAPGHTVGAKSLHSGFFSGATGGASTSHTGPSATNVYAAPWSTTGGPGTLTYGYNTPVGADFNQSWIVPGIHNGRYTLDFIGGGSGFAAPISFFPSPLSGIFFQLVININGNWSQLGTGFGQVEWLGYTGSGYTVDNLFTYTNGVTTLVLSNENWDALSPNASFRLYGESVVPEPATLVLLGTGLLGLGAMNRLRRRHTVSG